VRGKLLVPENTIPGDCEGEPGTDSLGHPKYSGDLYRCPVGIGTVLGENASGPGRTDGPMTLYRAKDLT
jgi:hypothetical protein